MRNYKQCPECGTYDTERVHTEQFTDMLERTRICNECPTQFTNKYDLFEQEVDDVPGAEG
jgi:transcriptional regulator NrdR family protein